MILKVTHQGEVFKLYLKFSNIERYELYQGFHRALYQRFSNIGRYLIALLSNLWPTGRMWPARQLYAAREVIYFYYVLAESMK